MQRTKISNWSCKFINKNEATLPNELIISNVPRFLFFFKKAVLSRAIDFNLLRVGVTEFFNLKPRWKGAIPNGYRCCSYRTRFLYNN